MKVNVEEIGIDGEGQYPVKEIGIDGTHLQGEFSSSFEKIKSHFGDPTLSGPGDKIQAEWRIQFDDGTVATIYDWKEFARAWSLRKEGLGK